MAIDTQKRWIAASLVGVGDVCFETEESISGNHPLAVRKICQVMVTRHQQTGQMKVNVERATGYALGLLSDPVTIMPYSITYSSRAPRQLAEVCDQAWTDKSDIVIAPESTLRRLNGGK